MSQGAISSTGQGVAPITKASVVASMKPVTADRLEGGEIFTSNLHDLEAAAPPFWAERTRIILHPIAPPSILGLYGYGAATFVFGAFFAGWFGSDTMSPPLLAPFAFFLGGLAQFAAGMKGYTARDGMATAFHGIWGAVWFAVGLLWILISAGYLPPFNRFNSDEIGYWFIALAVITCCLVLASWPYNHGFMGTLILLAAGCILAAIGFIHNQKGCVNAAGWCFVFSSFIAWYTATAMLCENTYGHVVLPLLRPGSKMANRPGETVTYPIEYPYGMPGSRVSQM